MHKLSALLAVAIASTSFAQTSAPVLTGKDAFANLTQEKPGIRRHITVADLPAPNMNYGPIEYPHIVSRNGAIPVAPPGFKVTLYADGFTEPRLMRTAPNGDIFLSETGAGRVVVLRGIGPDGKATQRSTFATKIDHPFGIAFYPLGPNPQWIYVAYQTGVVRYPYKNGDMVASGKSQTVVSGLGGIVSAPGASVVGHFTKDVVFTSDGRNLLISVGAASDDVENHDFKAEHHRANILEYTPDGKFVEVYAGGLRNCVGEAINPVTGQLWCSVNERNWMGDNLVPDFVSSVPEGSFFGWPFWYIGDTVDPRFADHHPTLQKSNAVPDVLLTAHAASLEMVFYPDSSPSSVAPAGASFFPDEYRGDAFAAEHGSLNRTRLTGYEVLRIPLRKGHATGEYEDFLTGFDHPDGSVWGRPVGVTVGLDGSLYVSDDVSDSIWRVAYSPSTEPAIPATPPSLPPSK